MTKIAKITSIAETNRDDAKQLLQECIEEGFDSVIVLGFRHKEHNFAIRSSKIHHRLELLGAMREAEHHLITHGVAI